VESEGHHGLVLELIEGDTLAEVVARGPVPVAEALGIAGQIASALEAAHDKGIIHRDLKPANIKLTREGVVKVLDFGLAKALLPDDAAASADLSASPTITASGTRAGVILGTAAYMSPEQARGRVVDKRADIWAFGCVLFEMLTARSPFMGESITDSLAKIIGAEPDWQALPDETPASVRRLLRRCLAKDRSRRLRDVADARLEIDEALSMPGSPLVDETHAIQAAVGAPTGVSRLFAVVLSVIALAAIAVATWSLTRPTQPPSMAVRFSIHLGSDAQFPVFSGQPVVVAIAPSGDRIAYVARRANNNQLYVRRLDELDPRVIPGTEGAIGPFFSPDGESIGFAAANTLRVVSLSGGTPRTIANVLSPTGASWGPDDTVVFSQWNGGFIKSVRAGR
jgi:serine/threonine-protein kinase